MSSGLLQEYFDASIELNERLFLVSITKFLSWADANGDRPNKRTSTITAPTEPVLCLIRNFIYTAIFRSLPQCRKIEILKPIISKKVPGAAGC